MDRDRLLATVSTAQLAVGILGMGVALRRRHAYHLPLLHGRPDKVARDSLLMGTALSAPMVMLVAQGVAIFRLRHRIAGRDNLALGLLGAMMVPGYLAESHVRRRLRRSGWDRIESPLIVSGIALAAGMIGLGFRGGRAAPLDPVRAVLAAVGSPGPATR